MRKSKAQAEIEKWEQEAAYFKAQAENESYAAEITRMSLEKATREHQSYLAGNVENRVLDFTQEVNNFAAESAMATLARWARLSRDPITVRWSSPGGSVIAGLALYDAIMGLRQVQKINIRSITLGMAASMAAILLQSGDQRVVAPDAYILIHEVSSGVIGKLAEMEDETKFVKKINDRLFSILASRSNLSRRAILTHARRKDWWLDAEETLKHGFADEIGYL